MSVKFDVIKIKCQQGTTLIVALVILAIVTIIGITSMRGTNLEMKMIASARDRAIAFEAAESALRIAEQDLEDNPPQLATLTQTYQASCAKGRCFDGVYNPDDPYNSCSILPVSATSAPLTNIVPFWERPGVWKGSSNDSNNLHLTTLVSKPNGATIPVKYIVEFMCFTLKDRNLLSRVDDRSPPDLALIYIPMFRITALASGPGGRSQVAAQSIAKVDLEPTTTPPGGA